MTPRQRRKMGIESLVFDVSSSESHICKECDGVKTGADLRRLRLRLGLKQRRLAFLLKATRNTLSQWERLSPHTWGCACRRSTRAGCPHARGCFGILRTFV